MKQTSKIMLALLGAAVSGTAVNGDVKENMTAERLKKLYALSCHHDMAHLVAHSLSLAGLLGNDEVGEAFRRSQLLAVFRETEQSGALAAIGEAFERAGVDYLPLKGAVIRQRYPEPWMRIGCDVDVLVRPEELERAATCLCDALGYKRGNRNAHDLTLTSPEGVTVELHFDMIESDCAANSAEVLGRVWEYAHAEKGAHGYALRDDMFYFYHLAHMAKHFEHGGCGVKPFLDMWLLCREPYDGEARRALLKEGGLSDFDAACRKLCEAWFAGQAWDSLCEDMSRYLLTAGMYGDAEHKAAVGSAKQGGRGRSLWARIWVPYDVLRGHYPSLEGRRWLIPLYQGRRWLRLLRKDARARSAAELKAGSSVSAERSRETASLLSRLGL